MKGLIDQILEIYFLGGNLNEILGAVGEYRQRKYTDKLKIQMFSNWKQGGNNR